ncbi:hypothetical protein WK68_24785 [Burkholderia ubonensis]|nr:hypothetical protein WK68_24785 [Burkholderia ubonensis]
MRRRICACDGLSSSWSKVARANASLIEMRRIRQSPSSVHWPGSPAGITSASPCAWMRADRLPSHTQCARTGAPTCTPTR